MVVGTVDAAGRPVTRTVLCKSVDEPASPSSPTTTRTRASSSPRTPYASATFPWYALGRQVHVRGAGDEGLAEATADYWSKRPRGSQLGAWASHQSQPDRVACGAARAARRRHRAVRRPRVRAGAAELGRLPDRARGRRVLAGPREPGAQPDSGDGRHGGGSRPRRATAALGVASLFADTTPLRTPDFRRLWLAGIVTVIGANLTIFAVPVQLYALTQNSAYVGLSGLFALVPLVVFGLWGGAWADAMDRRLLLIIASIGLAVASVLLWLQAALGLNNVWVVLCLLSVQQAFFAINTPTRSAAIPRMLPAGATARGQFPEHDGDAVRRHRRPAAGRGAAALRRPVDAVRDRRRHLHGADLGDVPAGARCRRRAPRRARRSGVSRRCSTGSATWRATGWC